MMMCLPVMVNGRDGELTCVVLWCRPIVLILKPNCTKHIPMSTRSVPLVSDPSVYLWIEMDGRMNA